MHRQVFLFFVFVFDEIWSNEHSLILTTILQFCFIIFLFLLYFQDLNQSVSKTLLVISNQPKEPILLGLN